MKHRPQREAPPPSSADGQRRESSLNTSTSEIAFETAHRKRHVLAGRGPRELALANSWNRQASRSLRQWREKRGGRKPKRRAITSLYVVGSAKQ